MTATTPTPTFQAGWYQINSLEEGYWTGARWDTRLARPLFAPPSAPAAAQSQVPSGRTRLIWVAVLVAVVIAWGIASEYEALDRMTLMGLDPISYEDVKARPAQVATAPGEYRAVDWEGIYEGRGRVAMPGDGFLADVDLDLSAREKDALFDGQAITFSGRIIGVSDGLFGFNIKLDSVMIQGS